MGLRVVALQINFILSAHIYLRKEVYIFLLFCLSMDRITQNVVKMLVRCVIGNNWLGSVLVRVTIRNQEL